MRIAIASLMIGLLGLAVSVFGWLGITPESVGQAAYDTVKLLLPFITFAFGVLFGWSTNAIVMKDRDKRELYKRVRKLTKEQGEIAQGMVNLTDQQNNVLRLAYERSYYDASKEDMDYIDQSGQLLKFLVVSSDPVDGDVCRWYLTEDARRVGNELPEVFNGGRRFESELQEVRDAYEKDPYGVRDKGGE